ncbi:glycosyltransferase [Candidatus Rariloculus sp.]|uniref:glycosyltransferase n=1 Tax=Candidatus Rariloculus sp. TaxID=3101265 RepID=UPI003D134B78
MVLTVVSAAALLGWASVLLLPSRPYRIRERFEPDAFAADLGDVAVLIPARNEADIIETTLDALARQGPGLTVYVIDDESTDATAALCRRAADRLRLPAKDRFPLMVVLIAGQPLPADWSGKLWTLQQGLEHASRPYTVLLDADITLDAHVLPSLLGFARDEAISLVSIMATLRCRGFWERLLVPPFIFFFKLLYPFARVNAERSTTAAAAGGCILIETRVLRSIGGFKPIRGALIDDCALAAEVKRRGQRIWLGLSRAVTSRRPYPELAHFWRMVSRTAFTQLRYSLVLLLATTALMAVMFLGPVAALVNFSSTLSMTLGGLGLAAMAAAYTPVVRFYRLPVSWALTLPVAATLLLAMTWSSAIGCWRGTRARWKNRAYQAFR